MPLSVLDFSTLNGQFGEDVVDEADRGLLIVGRVGLQHAQAGAVIDGGVLVVALLLARLAQRFDELHVHLQGMAIAADFLDMPQHRELVIRPPFNGPLS